MNNIDSIPNTKNKFIPSIPMENSQKQLQSLNSALQQNIFTKLNLQLAFFDEKSKQILINKLKQNQFVLDVNNQPHDGTVCIIAQSSHVKDVLKSICS